MECLRNSLSRTLPHRLLGLLRSGNRHCSQRYWWLPETTPTGSVQRTVMGSPLRSDPNPNQDQAKPMARHRLNRGGDRQANAALYRIVLTRMSSDPETKDLRHSPDVKKG